MHGARRNGETCLSNWESKTVIGVDGGARLLYLHNELEFLGFGAFARLVVYCLFMDWIVRIIPRTSSVACSRCYCTIVQ